MSELFVRAYNRPLVLLNSVTTPLAPGATVGNPLFRVAGFRFLYVMFHVPAAGGAPAAGFPRVRQSMNPLGGIFDVVDTIAKDPAQLPEQVYEAILDVQCDYIEVLYTDGGGGAASLRSFVKALPG